MKTTHILLIAFLLPCLVTACKRDVPQSHVTDLPDPAGTVPVEPAAEVAVGAVIETMNAASYTYVLVDTGVEKIWAAAPVCQVKVGDELGISKAMPMRGWRSPTLDRKFDLVYFVGGFQKPDGTPLSGGGHGMVGAPSTGRSSGPTNVEVGVVEKAAGGKTVAEIHAEKAELAGKEVTLRGKVTKYNARIMGKNWLHIQDGSGDAASGTHDLTVTSAATAKLGDTVLVTGKLQLDKDFGSGYKYSVILEDAQIVVE